MKFKPIFKRRLTSLILTAGSFLGTILTGYFAHKNTKKAIALLEEMDEHPETWQEELKLTYQCYIPTGIAGVATLVCIGLNKYNDHKYIKGFLPAAGLGMGLLREYEEKARELLGDEQVEMIKNAVAEDHLLDIQKAKPPVISVKNADSFMEMFEDIPDDGDVIFYDELFQVSFRSSKDAVRAGILYFEREFSMLGWSTVKDLYDLWGAECTTVCDPQRYAWSSEYTCTAYDASWVDIHIKPSRRKIRLKNGDIVEEEYYTITYPVMPILEEFASSDRNKIDWFEAMDETESFLIKEIDR